MLSTYVSINQSINNSGYTLTLLAALALGLVDQKYDHNIMIIIHNFCNIYRYTITVLNATK